MATSSVNNPTTISQTLRPNSTGGGPRQANIAGGRGGKAEDGLHAAAYPPLPPPDSPERKSTIDLSACKALNSLDLHDCQVLNSPINVTGSAAAAPPGGALLDDTGQIKEPVVRASKSERHVSEVVESGRVFYPLYDLLDEHGRPKSEGSVPLSDVSKEDRPYGIICRSSASEPDSFEPVQSRVSGLLK